MPSILLQARRLAIGFLLMLALGGSLASSSVDLEWTDLSGSPFRIDTLRGQVTVLNFWATWCKPCVEEMPDLADLQARLGPQGVQVLGASADAPEKADAVRRFARRHGISFRLVLGATTEQMTAVGLPPTLPGTVILDRQGNVVRRYPGIIDRDVLEEALREVLDGDPGAAKKDAADAADDVDVHDEAHDEDAGHAHAHDHKPSAKASLVPS